MPFVQWLFIFFIVPAFQYIWGDIFCICHLIPSRKNNSLNQVRQNKIYCTKNRSGIHIASHVALLLVSEIFVPCLEFSRLMLPLQNVVFALWGNSSNWYKLANHLVIGKSNIKRILLGTSFNQLQTCSTGGVPGSDSFVSLVFCATCSL